MGALCFFRRRLWLAAYILPLLAIPSISKGDNYLWPLAASKDLTSGFCQWRSGHFHSGIDIGTFGKTGYEVRAIGDGSVSRIVTKWRGYGKALYLRLDDGRIAVYGHLLKFTPEMDRYVQQEQLAVQRYTTDIYPADGRFRFRAGDIVAYTGQSGTGAPHLHFEIRTADEMPLSPLVFYPELKDDLPPTIRAVSFRPLSAVRSRVDGVSDIRSVNLSFASGRYVSHDTVVVYGPIGIELECVDRRPDSRRVFTVSGIEMYIDSLSEPFFTTRYDTVDFERWSEIDLEINYSRSLDGQKFVHNLYLLPGMTAPLVNDIARNRGIIEVCDSVPGIDMSAGAHRLLLLVSDPSGNVSRCEVPIELRRYPEIPGGTGTSAGNPGDRSEGWIYAVARYDRVAGAFVEVFSEPDISPFLAYLDGDVVLAERYADLAGSTMLLSAAADGIKFHRLLRLSATGMPVFSPYSYIPSSSLAVAPIRSRYNSVELDIGRLVYAWDDLTAPAASVCISVPVLFDEVDSSLSVDPDAVAVIDISDIHYARPFAVGGTGANRIAARFADGHLVVGGRELQSRSAIALDTATIVIDRYGPVKAFVISPQDLLLSDKMDLTLRIPAELDSSRVAIYWISHDGRASYLGGNVMGDSAIHVVLSRMGMYAVLQDTIPPVISKLTPSEGGRVRGSRPRIAFKMSDDLSGIGDDTDVHIAVDGIWAIPEYDVESSWMVTYSSQDLSPGTHILEIRARDRAGNEVSISSSFDYVE